MSLAKVRKLVVAGIGALAQAVAAGLLPAKYEAWGAVILALATALGVYAVPNAPTAP